MIALAGGLLLAAAVPFPVIETVGGEPFSLNLSANPATVVVFVSAVCPIANDYAVRLSQLQRELSGRGVPLLLVYANRTESAADVAANAKGHEFSFAVYRDPKQELADRLRADVTPTAYVLDRQGEVRYSGRVDDALQPARVKRRYVREAVDAVLAGRGPDPARVEPYG